MVIPSQRIVQCYAEQLQRRDAGNCVEKSRCLLLRFTNEERFALLEVDREAILRRPFQKVTMLTYDVAVVTSLVERNTQGHVINVLYELGRLMDWLQTGDGDTIRVGRARSLVELPRSLASHCL